MKRWLLSGVLATTILAGCTSLKVDMDYDPARDFTAYHSYAWIPVPPNIQGAATRNDLVDARVTGAVNTELAKPQVEPSKLTQLATQLGDLQKQYASLRGN